VSQSALSHTIRGLEERLGSEALDPYDTQCGPDGARRAAVADPRPLL
jgi:hypothetical protein